MRQTIIQELDKIEKRHAVKIILASESGSRAWGFPSSDSDYDVRFIYVNRPEWYMTIGNKKDVIELPVDEVLDINGWDLKKALQLMKKSSVPLMEWLSSPIQYRTLPHLLQYLTALSQRAFMPETACHHYLSMARKYAKALDNDKNAKLKTIMYAVRALLCCEWIIRHRSHPPMHISDVFAGIEVASMFKDEVNTLIGIKKKHPETYKAARPEAIERYISEKIAMLPEKIPKNPERPSLDVFDDVFLSIVTKSFSA